MITKAPVRCHKSDGCKRFWLVQKRYHAPQRLYICPRTCGDFERAYLIAYAQELTARLILPCDEDRGKPTGLLEEFCNNVSPWGPPSHLQHSSDAGLKQASKARCELTEFVSAKPAKNQSHFCDQARDIWLPDSRSHGTELPSLQPIATCILFALPRY
jgi:hypothetical protein